MAAARVAIESAAKNRDKAETLCTLGEAAGEKGIGGGGTASLFLRT